MREWKESAPETSVQINYDKFADSLEDLERKERQHKYDKVVIAWFHLAKLITYSGEPYRNNGTKERLRNSKSRFFDVMRTNLYTGMLEDIPDNWDTDEKPTDFMYKLYGEYLEYCNKKKNTPAGDNSKKVGFEDSRHGERK